MTKKIRYFIIFSLLAILFVTSMIYAAAPDMVGISNLINGELKAGSLEIKGVILNNGQICRVAVKTGIGPWVDATGVDTWSYTVNPLQIVLSYENIFDSTTGQYVQTPVYGPYYGDIEIIIGAFDAGGNEIAAKTVNVTIVPEKPYSDIISGVYSESLNVVLKEASEVTIYYTTDGTDPKTSGISYTGAIPVSGDTVIKAVAKSANNQFSEISILDIKINPSNPPVFQIQYYEDQAFSRPLPDPAYLKAGTYYLKIVSDRKFSSGPFIDIDAPGYSNDAVNAGLTSVSDCVYQYTRIVTEDSAATGDTQETIKISGTDDSGNPVQNIIPTNSTTKAAYLDTQPPASGSIALTGGVSSTNDPTPKLEISSTGAGQMRLALSEAELTNAPWVEYAAQYDELDISKGGNGSKAIWIEFKDRAGNIQTQSHAYTSVSYDNSLLSFDIEYYSDSGLTQTLGNNPCLKEGAYFLKITANQDVSNNPALQIDAEGLNNDVTSGVTTMVNSRIFYYTRTIVADSAAVGAAREQITIQGMTPSNIDSKTAYTDTQAPGVPVVSGPATTINLKPTWSWNNITGATRYRYSFSDGSSWVETTVTSFTPANNLTADCSYVLYVQAGDRAGNWSNSGSFSITINTPPKINIRQGTIDIPNGTGNYDFGNVSFGSNRTVTFTIENTGTSEANLTSTPKVQIIGVDASVFSVTVQPSSPLGACQSTTFEVEFISAGPGTKSAIVSIASNDSDKNPYTFTITGTGAVTDLTLNTWTEGNITTAGEIKIYSIQVVPGKPYGISWDHSPMGSGTYTASLKVIAYRQDFSTTYFADTFDGYTDPQCFIARDNIVYITVEGYYPSTTGSFALKAFLDEPVMNVKQGTTVIPDDGNYDFGNVALCAGTYATAFTIENTGTGNLNLTGTPKVQISGTDAASFYVSEEPAATVAPGGSTTFKLRCVPTGTGIKTATVSIATNDPAGTPYTFTITGTGMLAGTLTLDTWTEGSISAPYERKTYCLHTIPGKSYAITWDDAPYGSGTYSGDIVVSVFGQDLTTHILYNEDYHFWSFPVEDNNIIYITVYGKNNSSTGSFALKAYVYEPVMNVIQGDVPPGTSIANNGNCDLGNVSQCTTKEFSFLIENTGNASLRLTGNPYIQISGNDAACFSVTKQPGSYNVFGDGGYSGFSIKFTPPGPGTKTATVTIPSNDHHQDPYVFTITATGTGSFTPLTLDKWVKGTVYDILLYSFRTTPGTDYAIAWNDLGHGPGDYTGDIKVSAFRRDMVNTYFRDWDDGADIPEIITAQEDIVYLRVVAKSASTIGSFAIQVSVSEPAINVTRGTTGINIPNGTGSYSYGPVTVNSSSDANFTIDNYAGDGILQLSGTPKVQITGPDASSFSVTTQPRDPIYPNRSEYFVVRFSPVSIGTKTATISIASNAPDKNPYTFTVTGYGASAIEKTLTFDSWTEGNITTAGEDKYYSFYVTAGRRYAIVWDDRSQGSGAYTGDIKVSAYRNDYVTPYFTGIDSGYATPQFITGQDNIVYIQAAGLDSAATGSFALKVVEVKIYVKQGTTDIFNGTGSYDYGNISVGLSGSATFTIHNIGDALNLTGSPKVQVSGADASCFTVTAQPSSPVMWHTDATFAVTFTPSGIGTRTATIRIVNDAPCMDPYTFTVTGTGASTNLTPGAWTQGNLSTEGEVKSFYFNATPGSAYSIAWDDSYQGSGAYYGNIKVSAYLQNLTSTYFNNINSGYSTPQIITAQESIVYIQVAGFTTSSTGTFALKVSLNKPAINIKQGTTVIPNNSGSYNFGNVSPGSSSSAPFTIQNTGTVSLNLTGSPKVQISGADASYFSVTTQASSPVAAGGSTTFTVKFTSSGTGTKTATVSIASNDTANNPYTFTITGTPATDTLTPGVWTSGNISAAGEVKTYLFNATSGKKYAIGWDDSYQGSKTYTCDIKVTAYRQDLITTYFSNVDSGYTTPKTITAQDGMVYIKVEGYSYSSTGSYAIKVTEVN